MDVIASTSAAERLLQEDESHAGLADETAAAYDRHLARFASAFESSQRKASWYRAMGVTIGGSELAALMGLDPYKRAEEIVRQKVAHQLGGAGFAGGPACWWGTVFEEVITRYVEADLGAPVRGDSICIRQAVGHRTSPDGYIAAWYLDAERTRLWRRSELPAGPPPGARPAICLLEFKCPTSRIPAGRVPPQYQPQVWSGLAVSPFADRGLFVDAVFRKCSLAALGPSAEYDLAFHARRQEPAWKAPCAWGLAAVYEPLPVVTQVAQDRRDADPMMAVFEDARASRWAPRADPAFGAVDLGAAARHDFNRVLKRVCDREALIRHLAPCLASGPPPPRWAADLRACVAALKASAPPGHQLAGVLPWKLFSVSYHTMEPRPGFLDEVRPVIAAVHELVAAALATDDPSGFLDAHYGTVREPSSGFTVEDLYACT